MGVINHGLLVNQVRPSLSTLSPPLPRTIPVGRVLFLMNVGNAVIPVSGSLNDGLFNAYSNWQGPQTSDNVQRGGPYARFSVCTVITEIPAGTTIQGAFGSSSLTAYDTEEEHLFIWELEGADASLILGQAIVRNTPGIPTFQTSPYNPFSNTSTVNVALFGTPPKEGDFGVLLCAGEHVTKPWTAGDPPDALSGISLTTDNALPGSSTLLDVQTIYNEDGTHANSTRRYSYRGWSKAILVENFGENGNGINYVLTGTLQGVSNAYSYLLTSVWVRATVSTGNPHASMLRQPLTKQLTLSLPEASGAATCRLFTDAETDTVEANINVAAAANITRTEIRATPDGVLWYGYMNTSGSLVVRVSTDTGLTWAAMTNVGSGYSEGTFNWSNPRLGQHAYCVFMLYKTNKWYMSVGSLDGSGTFNLTTLTDIGVAANQAGGTIHQRDDGVWEFLYKNTSNNYVIVRCESIGTDGSNSGWS